MLTECLKAYFYAQDSAVSIGKCYSFVYVASEGFVKNVTGSFVNTYAQDITAIEASRTELMGVMITPGMTAKASWIIPTGRQHLAGST